MFLQQSSDTGINSGALDGCKKQNETKRNEKKEEKNLTQQF